MVEAQTRVPRVALDLAGHRVFRTALLFQWNWHPRRGVLSKVGNGWSLVTVSGGFLNPSCPNRDKL